jgi:hypothetical protein
MIVSKVFCPSSKLLHCPSTTISLLGKSELHPARQRQAETASPFKNGTTFFVGDFVCLFVNVIVFSLSFQVTIGLCSFFLARVTLFRRDLAMSAPLHSKKFYHPNTTRYRKTES